MFKQQVLSVEDVFHDEFSSFDRALHFSVAAFVFQSFPGDAFHPTARTLARL